MVDIDEKNDIEKGENEMFGFKKKVVEDSVVITVEGMMCQHCAARVTAALEAVKGVSSVAIDLEAKTATLTTGEGFFREAAVAAVVEAGYKVIGA